MNDRDLIKGLLDFLPQCRQCEATATKKSPTGEIGYFVYACDEHARPGCDEYQDAGPHELPQAEFVRIALARIKETA